MANPRRGSTRGRITSAINRQPIVSTANDAGRAGQAHVAAGALDPIWATSTIGWTHQPASQPKTSASVGLTSETSAATSPNTVTGPTNGPAATLAASPTMVSNQDYGVGDASFVTSKADRPPMLYVGANDGMLHAFRESDGVERFAYIPAETVLKLNKLTDANYPQNHQYLVDGSPKVGDAKFGSNWKTILLGTTGAGGKTVFALHEAPDEISRARRVASVCGPAFLEQALEELLAREIVHE